MNKRKICEQVTLLRGDDFDTVVIIARSSAGITTFVDGETPGVIGILEIAKYSILTDLKNNAEEVSNEDK